MRIKQAQVNITCQILLLITLSKGTTNSMPNAKFKIAFINNNNKHVSLPSSLDMGSLQGFACLSLYSEQCGMFPLGINARNYSYVAGPGTSVRHTRHSFLVNDCF